MKCPNGCKTDMELKSSDKLYKKDGRPLIIKDLQMRVCPECGQETIPLSSMRIIENILTGKLKSVATIEADVYSAS